MFSLGALIFFAFKIFRKVVSVQKIHFFIVRRYKSLKPYVFFFNEKVLLLQPYWSKIYLRETMYFKKL